MLVIDDRRVLKFLQTFDDRLILQINFCPCLVLVIFLSLPALHVHANRRKNPWIQATKLHCNVILVHTFVPGKWTANVLEYDNRIDTRLILSTQAIV
jgi:hypothetical protein